MTNGLFTSIFPNEDMAPEKYRLVPHIERRQCRCEGAIKEWTGPQQDVFLPICEAIDDTFRRKPIGSYPLLTESRPWTPLMQLAGASIMDEGCADRVCQETDKTCRSICLQDEGAAVRSCKTPDMGDWKDVS
jgi:hypothetical protein